MQFKSSANSRFRAICSLICFVAICFGQSRAEVESVSIGRDIFLGSGKSATNEMQSCASCHGRDGRGQSESQILVPAVRRGFGGLDKDTIRDGGEFRPGYDGTAFARLLTSGIASNGREISVVMPRYSFPSELSDALFDYLAELDGEQAQGVGDSALTFSILIGEGTQELGQEILGKLDSGATAIYGRKLRFVLEDASKTKTGECFGVGSLAIVLASGVDRQVLLENATRCGTPVIAPAFPLLGLEDSALVRGVSATLQSQWASVKIELGVDPALALPMNISKDEAESLRLAFGERYRQSSNNIVLAPFGLDFAAVRNGRKIYAPLWQSMEGLPPWQQNFESIILLSPVTPLDVSEVSEPVILRQASITAELLRMAAKAAGPEPTRHSFVAAFDSLHIESSFWPPLDFRRNRLAGSEIVYRLEMK